MKLNEIHLRDPFILAERNERTYYLYGTNGPNPWDNPIGFDAYTSNDLAEWNGPFPVLRPPVDFWANKSFWAPEVYAHDGAYYLVASFTDTDCMKRRGVQIFSSDSALGPFVPHSDGPVTPTGDVCIDGTLVWDEAGDPWMVYCHERMQVIDGLMCAIKLSRDLRSAVGTKHNLFRASSASWTDPFEADQYTTDGPFIYRSGSGSLLMIWSSFHRGSYAMGMSRSPSGNVLGPWIHDDEPFFANDGGHGMIFRDLGERLLMVLHEPGMIHGAERPAIYRLGERPDELVIKGKFAGASINEHLEIA